MTHFFFLSRVSKLAALSLISAALVSCFLSQGGHYHLVMGVDRNKFRTCHDTGFCRRNREREIPSLSRTKYQVDSKSLSVHQSNGLLADVTPVPPTAAASAGDESALALSVQCFHSGVCRLRVVEKMPLPARWEAPEIILEEGLVPAEHIVIPAGADSLPTELRGKSAQEAIHISYGTGLLVSISFKTFSVHLYVNGQRAISANGKGTFYFEQQREKKKKNAVLHNTANMLQTGPTVNLPNSEKEVVDYGEDGLAIYADGTKETEEEAAAAAAMKHQHQLQHSQQVDDTTTETNERNLGMWEETFDKHPDSKPHGPQSVGIDVSFPGSSHVYGIPEHATSLSLPTTIGDGSSYTEPYRLYTLDVFQYELNNPMALYGVIPVIISHKAGQTAGVFWNNPTETFVDVARLPDGDSTTTDVVWMSESGIVDVMLIPGPTPAEVFDQYTRITGRPELPPLFALGYHQCRWNYRDTKDVMTVDAKFEELNFPYDVIWLDIEHTDGKRYFTWDKALFPDPLTMQKDIASHGRKMVTIVDPHIKRDNKWALHTEATRNGYYIKDKDGNDFDGWCWPGSSSYLDFTDAKVRKWWAERFSLSNYEGSSLDLYIWNDMNEPSVFNGPEVSMKKDCLNLEGIEHREWHNLYGLYMQRATAEGITLRHPTHNARPFVLSRAFWAGSQRWGAIWTGDNAAEWGHLAISSPMLLAMGVSGLPFVGADVGGFFGDPDAELFLRWMQAGSYQPFFRSHAHHDSKRREPWVFGEPWTSRLRDVVAKRYTLLPYWYTLFHQASVSGMPMMRPLWVEYPHDTNTFALDDQWLVGSDLLVKPVTAAGVDTLDVYLPVSSSKGSSGTSKGVWYDVVSHIAHEVDRGGGGGSGGGRIVTVKAAIDKIPVFQRGGGIVPSKERLRRSSKMMAKDPYTLTVALSPEGEAQGVLYLDDEDGFEYKDKGLSTLRAFSFSAQKLTCSAHTTHPHNYSTDTTVERVVVLGVKQSPAEVAVVEGGGEQAGERRLLSFEYQQKTGVLTIKKPDVRVTDDWVIELSP